MIRYRRSPKMTTRKCPAILSNYQPCGLETIPQPTADGRTVNIYPLGHRSFFITATRLKAEDSGDAVPLAGLHGFRPQAPREKNNKASDACGFALSVVMKSRGLSLARKSGQTPGSKSAQDARQLLFIAGVGLVASSFLVYPAYPLIILYLPFAGHVKFTVIVTAWILSWVIFGVGILLAGWEGYEIIKRPLTAEVLGKGAMHSVL